MNIRCEKCSTTYELDETLLAPEGSPVQCTKCQHVFTAVPPRTAGRTLVGVPAAPPPQPVAPPRASEPAAAAARQGPPIYRPTPGAASASAAARAPRPRRDTMGTFEARLKSGARLKWLVPLVAAVVAAVAVAGWLLLAGRVSPEALRRHAEAMALVAQDDVASLERGSQALDQLSREEVGIRSLEADRALAQSLLAAGLAEDVAPQVERMTARIAERDRLAATLPPPEVLAALSVEIEALRVQVEPRQSRARSLASEALSTLRRQRPDEGGEHAVARAMALHYVSTGDREQALRFIRGAGGGIDREPWLALAEAWLDAREEAREARERGASKLTALVAAHPELIRARYLLARTQAALGHRERAAATLDGLLAANPNHRRASRLREELVAAGPRPAETPPPSAPRPAPRPAAAEGSGAGTAPAAGAGSAQPSKVAAPQPKTAAQGGEAPKPAQPAPAPAAPVEAPKVPMMPIPDSAPVH